MGTFDLIWKIGCLFLIAMISVAFIVLMLWMINDMKK